MAIIVEKDSQGNPSRIRSVVFPPTREEEELALKFDALLRRKIPEIESELIHEGLLDPEMPDESKPAKGGNIKLWYALGKRIKEIVKDFRYVKPKEYRWALEAVKMYATSRILRKDRGPSRLHLDYCIGVAELPWEFVKKLTWDDWVFYKDSRSLREERRTDEWLKRRIDKIGSLTRFQFRELTKKLNHEFKEIETSLYADDELFSIYDSVLESLLSNKESEKQKS